MTTAKMKFLLSYNMKIIGRWGGGGEGMKRWCGITIWWRRDTVGAEVSSWLLAGGGRGEDEQIFS